MDFKHVSQNPDFPGVPEKFAYENDFDYERWSAYETDVRLVNVPWGTSEVAVGTRVYGGLGKVVKFENDAARDAYFNGLNGYSQVVPYRGFSQETLKVELPFDMAMQYNYCYLAYNPATSEDALIGYEGVNGVRRIYYFIRDIKYLAPNTTELVLLLDYWTTFVNSLEVKSLGVERGHIADSVTPAQYLANPRENSKHLLHEDVNTGELGDSAGAAQTVLLNDSVQYAIIAATANLQSCISNPSAVQVSAYDADITPNYYMTAVQASDIASAIGAIKRNLPNYINAIKGVYLVSRDAILISDTYQYSGITFYNFIAYPNYVADGVTLTVGDFPVNATPYANIAKLYTWPYSAVEVSDHFGNTKVVKVQDIGPNIGVEYLPAIAAPTMAVSMALLGVGDSTRNEVTFAAIRNGEYVQAGRETQFIWDFDIPCFAVSQAPLDDYLAHSAHDRAQAALEAQTAHDNAVDSANTANTNAANSATVNHENAYLLAETTKEIEYASSDAARTETLKSADVQLQNTRANSTATTKNNNRLSRMNNEVMSLKHRGGFYAADAGFVPRSAYLNWEKVQRDANIDKLLIQTAYEAGIDQAIASGVSNISAGFVTGAANGAMTMALASGGNPIATGVGSIVNAGVSAISSGISLSASLTADASIAANQQTGIDSKINNARLLAIDLAELQQTYDVGVNTTDRTYREDCTSTITDTNNANAVRTHTMLGDNADLSRDTANENADKLYQTARDTADNTLQMLLDNAGNTLATAIANADRAQDAALERIANTTRQRGLEAPNTYGAYSGNAAQATRPQGLKFQVISQAKGDLATAGDAMLRYGYYVNQWFDFTTFNVKPKFSYWKCFDFNIASNLPDAFADRIKVLLMDGITVYSKPEYVNEAGIFDNE